jgi:DNA-binding CsgD family transcriptional regulator
MTDHGRDDLIAREAALAAMHDACEAAAMGRGSVVAISGDPGTGKSRLLAEAHSAAEGRGLTVLSASGHEPEREHAFGIVLQLFERAISTAPAAERHRLLSGPARMAAPLLAEGAREAIPPGEAFSLLHGLHRLCTNLAGDGGLALVVDDAHWADEPSQRFLLYLIQRVEELPVVVFLGVGNEQGRETGDVLDQVVLHAASSVLQLENLSPDAVEALVAAQGLSRETGFCQACHGATGGNPFLLGELLTELAGRDAASTGQEVRLVPGVVPDTVSRATFARIRRAGEGAPELAAAVAVLGDDSELRQAAALAGIHSTTATKAADRLAEERIFTRSHKLAFVYPIVRAAVYADVPPGERGSAHLRAARLLRYEGVGAEQVAGQLVAAQRGGSAWVVEVLCDAAARAAARGVPSLAVDYLRRALEEPPALASRAKVMLELGRVEVIAGEAEAKDRLAAAIELIEDPRERAQGALDAGWALHSEGSLETAAACFARGHEDLGDADPDLRVQLEIAAASSRRMAGSGPNGAVPAEPFNGVSQASVRLVHAYRAFDGALSGRPHGNVLADARTALAQPPEFDSEAGEGLGYYLAAFALVAAGELEAAESALSIAIHRARARGSVLTHASACYLRSLARVRRGALEGALSDARMARSGRRYGWKLGLLGAGAVSVNALVERGELDLAGRELEVDAAADGGCDDLARAMHLAASGHWQLLRGGPEEALASFERAGEHESALGACNPAVISWRSGAARAAARLGDGGRAAALAGDEVRLARQFGAPDQIGRALHALASLKANGDRVETLEAAVGALEQSQARLDLARAQIDLGGALRRIGKRGEAREPLRSGLDLAERCGAAPLAVRARDELLTAGARPRRSALSGVEALTKRERQVAGMAAKGMANKEIAEALFVTVKTVEWHLRHAFRKLEVSSRVELGAAFGGTAVDAVAS